MICSAGDFSRHRQNIRSWEGGVSTHVRDFLGPSYCIRFNQVIWISMRESLEHVQLSNQLTLPRSCKSYTMLLACVVLDAKSKGTVCHLLLVSHSAELMLSGTVLTTPRPLESVTEEVGNDLLRNSSSSGVGLTTGPAQPAFIVPQKASAAETTAPLGCDLSRVLTEWK